MTDPFTNFYILNTLVCEIVSKDTAVNGVNEYLAVFY